MALSDLLKTADNGGATATTVLVIGEGAALFAAFCPSWFTVRSPFFHDQDARSGNVAAIRQGEIAGTFTTVLVGWAGSALSGSPWPFLGACAVSALMVAGYEWSIAHPATEYNKDKPKHPMNDALKFRGKS